MSRADLEALGRRAVACAGWRWKEGMLAVPAPGSSYEGWCRILRVSQEDGPVETWTDEDGTILDSEKDGDFATFADIIPWLGDPATLGCLLALVREKHGACTGILWVPDVAKWVVFSENGTPIATGDTEAAALVAALEADNAR